MRIEIEKALVFISQNFRQKLSSEKIAVAAGLSLHHFHRLFQKETGITPQKYVEKLRLEHAAHVMVLNPELKKIQLAFESGFSSPSAFSRAFKQYFGMSASEFQLAQPAVPSQEQLSKDIPDFKLNKEIEISYLPTLHFCTHLINPLPLRIEEKLLEHYSDLEKGIMYGIYLDAPIHQTLETCRYLLGKKTEDSSLSNAYIEAGYFVQLKLKGSIDSLREKILDLHIYLTQLSYAIREPIALERYSFDPRDQKFSYQEVERDFWIPVHRK